MKNILTVTLFLLNAALPLSVSAQSFKISHTYAQYFSYDKFANDVYYADYYLPDLYVKNLNTLEIRNCQFPSLPVFAHHSHKCIYINQDSIFTYDFNTNNTVKIADSIGISAILGYTFSPDDDYLLFGYHYYSLLDSSIHNIDFTPIPDLEYEWMNDTVIISSFGNIIYSFNFISNEYDTLIIASDQMPLSGFSYNIDQNLLYYSLDEGEYPRIHSYDPVSQTDSIIFDSFNSPDYCWPGPNHFRCMEWAIDQKRMAFFSRVIDGGDTIYEFDSDSGRVYRYTECGGDGYHYSLQWLKNDTIIYFNASDLYIYGFILENPLAVKEYPGEEIPASFEVSSYPNPFNGMININLRGKIKDPEIRIYNINGEEINRLDNFKGSGYQFTQVWNGKNNFGDNVSSGIYFVIVRDKADPLSIKGISKIIYLK